LPWSSLATFAEKDGCGSCPQFHLNTGKKDVAIMSFVAIDNSDALFSFFGCHYYSHQVVMDILGVFLTVIVSSLILDTPIGQMLTSKLSFSS
jgi:hypothetical protein